MTTDSAKAVLDVAVVIAIVAQSLFFLVTKPREFISVSVVVLAVTGLLYLLF